MISGFLITSLLLREVATTGRVSVRSFYARRALRLLPASSLVIAVTLGGAWLFLSKARLAEYADDALASAVYAVNFQLAAAGTDYLAQNSPPSPFQHFWSLAVEEQFYLVWPLLLLLTWRVARGRRRLVAVPLGALSLGSFAAGLLVTNSSAPWAYFGSLTRAWELGAGALLALATGRLKGLPAALAAPMTWLGLFGVTLAALCYDAETPFPGYHVLLPVAGTALVLAGGCAPTGRLPCRLRRHPLPALRLRRPHIGPDGRPLRRLPRGPVVPGPATARDGRRLEAGLVDEGLLQGRRRDHRQRPQAVHRV